MGGGRRERGCGGRRHARQAWRAGLGGDRGRFRGPVHNAAPVMKRVAIGGMRHETNTFAPTQADYDAFSILSAEPSPLEGEALLTRLRGANIPVQGALDRLQALGHDCVPLVWAAASPSAHVTEDAFERIIGRLVQRLREAGPVDGVLRCGCRLGPHCG